MARRRGRKSTRLALLAPLLAMVAVPLGIRSVATAATETFTPPEYIGDWTPDTTSNSLFVGHHFVVAPTASSPREATTGSNPSIQAQYDDYCNPNIAGTPVAYYILSYSWSPTGAMGGCTSPMTKGHIYVWGSHDDIAYVHPGTASDGEPLLKGGWGIEDFSGSSPAITYKKISAHRPVVNLVTHIKVSQVVPQHSHQYRQTEISTVGEIRLTSRPADGCAAATDWESAWSDGSMDLQITKVGGPNFIDLYNLTLSIGKPNQGAFQICDNGFGYADAIPVRVTKADPSEKDACPRHATGSLDLESHAVNAGGDDLHLSLPRCKLDLGISQAHARKGDRVVVVLDLNRDGY